MRSSLGLVLSLTERDLIQITPTLAIEDHEVDERFVRASGPGGQHVNKVATAVEWRFDIGRSSLPPAVQVRLRALAGSRVTAQGVLLLEAREHRSQTKNRAAARARFVALVRLAAVEPRRRRKTKPSRASREDRLRAKAHRGGRKAARRGVRGQDE